MITPEMLRACVFDDWPVPIKQLDVTWFAQEVAARLANLSFLPPLEVRNDDDTDIQ